MPKKKARPDNFRRLPDDDTKTRQIIDGILGMLNPVPWQDAGGRPPSDDLSALADRIQARADRGKTVILKPETAAVVSEALRQAANGPVLNHPRDFPFELIMLDAGGFPTSLAYCRNVDYAIGAFDAAVAKLPGARLEVRWGQMRPRKNYK